MEGYVVPETSFSDFAEELCAGERRIPLYGSIETTFRCNLRCIHCYVNEPVHSQSVRSRELSLDRILRLIDEIAEAGCLQLLLTGGEVLVRSDFPQVYSYAIRRGLRVTVFTNGTLVTDRVIRLFGSLPPARVEITLYGITPETYERITRVHGSFDRCMRGIMKLHERGIPLGLKAMVMNWNKDEIPSMKRFAEQLGVRFRHDGLLNPRIDGFPNCLADLQLPTDQLIAIDLGDAALRNRQQEAAVRLLAADPPTSWGDQIFSCGAGLVAFNVAPYGGLQLCQLSRHPSFDLRDDSFEKGWNDVLPAFRARKWSKDSICRGCTLLPLCVNCPGASELEHGDPERPAARFCKITHFRTHAVLGEIQAHRPDASCCLGRSEGGFG